MSAPGGAGHLADDPEYAWSDDQSTENDAPDDDLPTAQSYVAEYAWACPECGEVHGTDDFDLAGTVQDCAVCHLRVQVTT